jgi:hypothetical protein
MTDFEDTEEVIEGPPSLEAGEADVAHYERLERRAEPFRSYRHVPGYFNDRCVATSNPTLLSAHRSQSSTTSTMTLGRLRPLDTRLASRPG